MHEMLVVLFCMAAGFTASGIVANLYRLLVPRKESGLLRAAYFAAMVVAGPIVLLGNANKARRAKSVPVYAFWAAAAICGYWSLAIGMFVVELSLSLAH